MGKPGNQIGMNKKNQSKPVAAHARLRARAIYGKAVPKVQRKHLFSFTLSAQAVSGEIRRENRPKT